MKLGIVGSRTFIDYERLKRKILKKYNIDQIDEIISGGAIGTDTLAEQFAKEYNIPIIVYKPNWSKYGKRCFAIRNQKIVDMSDKIIAFWDGESKGTKMTIDMAKKKGIKPYIVKFMLNLTYAQL